MAKTKIAAPLAGIRGTVGGLIYSANGSGTFVRAWNPPSNPKTVNQMIERSYLARMSSLWAALSPTQRSDWDDFAALWAQALTDSLGQTYYISGWLWFVKCNIRLLRVGRTPIQAVPTVARPAAPTITAFRVAVLGTETDLCAGGTPTASVEEPAHLADAAFDDTTTSFWSGTNTGLPQWLEYELSSASVVRQYALYITYPAYGAVPKSWTFEAFNGATWDTLDTQADYLMPDTGWYTFTFANEVSYSRYRINISKNRVEANTYALIFEMAFYDGILNRSLIAYPSATFSTITYDLILHVSMVISQARTVQYPGYYEILARQSPGNTFTTFQDEITNVAGTILDGRRWFARLYRQTIEGIRSAPRTDAANTST